MNAKSLGGWWHTGKKFALAHKFITGIVVIVVVLGGWWSYSKATSTSGETRYLLGTVASGTIVASLSESGQISASQQLNITSTATGKVLLVGVKPGQQVKAGTLIAEIDPTTAEKSVRDAQANLTSAKLALQKLQKPADALTLTQAENALTNANDALTKAYADSATDISNSFLEFPAIIEGIKNVEIGTDTNHSQQWNIDYYLNTMAPYSQNGQTYRDAAYNSYVAAKKSYDTAFADFNTLGANPDPATIEKVLSESYTMAGQISAAVKAANSYVQLYEDTLNTQKITPSTVADTALTNLNSYTGKTNTHLTALLADVNTLKTDKQSIDEKQKSLDQTKAGADTLDVQSSQLSVTKAENSLKDAEDQLANYYVKAPFDGTIATVVVNKYDQANGTLATLITNQQYADLSINEVDAAKVKIGEKATLTFDAIPNLTLTGTVAQLNPVGTVTQGVVNYNVKISLDAQNEQVKPGMTVNAKIITNTAQDALIVPSSAVKTQNGQSYVLVFDQPLVDTGGTQGVISKITPSQVPVEIGISDDTNVQILSGLSLGQQVVLRTVTGATAAGSASRTNTPTTNRGGGGFGGGGNIRIGG